MRRRLLCGPSSVEFEDLHGLVHIVSDKRLLDLHGAQQQALTSHVREKLTLNLIKTQSKQYVFQDPFSFIEHS